MSNRKFRIRKKTKDHLVLEMESKEFVFDLVSRKDNEIIIRFEGNNHKIFCSGKHVLSSGRDFYFEDSVNPFHKKAMAGSLRSAMPGKIVKILVKKGDKVKKGEPLLIMEAMKMEHTIKAQNEGIVRKIFFKEGEQVAEDTDLLEIAGDD